MHNRVRAAAGTCVGGHHEKDSGAKRHDERVRARRVSRVSHRELVRVAVQSRGCFVKANAVLREIRFGRTPIGRVPSQVDYSDYRAVDGIKFPFQYKFQWLDGRDTYTLTDVKVNVPIDESRFGKPSSGSDQ